MLIDADNVSPEIVDGLFGVIAMLGDATVRRIYGDWTGANMRGWKSRLGDHAIRPVQQFASCPEKNATDGAMIIDAMDLLHRNRLDGFCIASSDGDFTRLAVRIREEGVFVHGFGDRQTPASFIAACSSFTRFDRLRPSKEMRWLSATTAENNTDRRQGDRSLRACLAADAGDDRGGRVCQHRGGRLVTSGKGRSLACLA
ncbi:NYN domain-containing protein [Agrobacterium radiobacter]|uniref:NYN domain-containing protein n=1 Tax=Agrobacterium radiobacter TaxID=362 RepID=UPI003CE5B2A7